MPEWLADFVTTEPAVSPQVLAMRLVLALVFGGAVATVYRLSHGKKSSDAPELVTTLVLLSVLIAMVSVVIGNSVARAFSLVGALSIVRFRTVVDDTRDTAFVIFAVIVGMAVGTGLPIIPLVGIPIVSIAAFALHHFGSNQQFATAREATLNVRLTLGKDPDELLGSLLSQFADDSRVTFAGTARQGTVLEVVYALRLKSDAAITTLVSELNRIDGVQSVELKRT